MQLKTGKPIRGISKEAMDILMRYAWPGNVRELRSTFEYAFVTCQSANITPADLPPTVLQGAETNPTAESSLPASNPVSGTDRFERQKQELLDALQATGGNQSQAAKILGISRVTVWNRMKRFKINAKTKIEAV